MKAQKSWDTPVADETRDVSDASEDIHGITDDITDDAESAEVDAEAVTLLRKRHRRMTLLVVVVIVASLVSGFCWRRSLQTGSPVNCSHQTGVADEKDYCYGGFKPLQPSGPQLGRSQAGPYFAKAVKGTAAAYDAVRLAAVGGDKDAVNKSAAKARDLSQQAAETLAARTWPKSLTKQIRMVIIEYQERAAIYTNLAGNRNGEAIDWMVFGEFRPSGAQQVIRSALKLPDEPETAVPFDIRDIADGGACKGLETTKDGGQQEVDRHCFTVTVTDHALPDGAGTLALLTLDNGQGPRRPATLGPATLLGLGRVLDEQAARAAAGAIQALAVTGVEGTFAAGADLSLIAGLTDDVGRDLALLGHAVYDRLAALETPRSRS